MLINNIRETLIYAKQKLCNIVKQNCKNEYPSILQGNILNYLITHDNEKVYATDIEKEYNLSRAAVSKAIIALENKGLIKRVNDGNSRIKYLYITKLGYDKEKEIENFIIELEKVAIKGLSKEEIETFENILNKIKNNLIK